MPCSASRPPASSSAAAINATAMPQASLRFNGGSPASSVDMLASTSTAESADVKKKIISSTSAMQESSKGSGMLSNRVNSTVS
ncbi:hypothetical protein G6F60_014809 [Rhizopus arrhizus]|nr:hypothetical protein G6F60_014809 [Rhizopus arrhizus]